MDYPYKFILKDFFNLPVKKASFLFNRNGKTNKFDIENSIELKTEKDKNEDLCPICFDIIRNKCTTDLCLHKFCYECLSTWVKNKKKCPLCRTEINRIIPLYPQFKSEQRKPKLKKYLFKFK